MNKKEKGSIMSSRFQKTWGLEQACWYFSPYVVYQKET